MLPLISRHQRVLQNNAKGIKRSKKITQSQITTKRGKEGGPPIPIRTLESFSPKVSPGSKFASNLLAKKVPRLFSRWSSITNRFVVIFPIHKGSFVNSHSVMDPAVWESLNLRRIGFQRIHFHNTLGLFLTTIKFDFRYCRITLSQSSL